MAPPRHLRSSWRPSLLLAALFFPLTNSGGDRCPRDGSPVLWSSGAPAAHRLRCRRYCKLPLRSSPAPNSLLRPPAVRASAL
ncbi:hypothetical protein NDU88_002345 [Pleurodeles waltl]|uniref:Secreted protein n=1 Tax=Pleurodeles waltl TaxID=8319 RepID=A0AAV7UVF4_PLEWA|nr:hypothetical protein NDU88_002345 [Pleurodeles waltl]